MTSPRDKARDAAARAKALAARIMGTVAERKMRGGDWASLEAAAVGIASLADAVLALADEADAMATSAIDARVRLVLRAACQDILRASLRVETLPPEKTSA